MGLDILPATQPAVSETEKKLSTDPTSGMASSFFHPPPDP